MALSRRCAETLLDLAEIKLSCLDVFDREDRDVAKTLAEAAAELKAMLAAPPRALPTMAPAEVHVH
jgi:hypothetical protein